jgi:DNA-binding protein YbaB
MGIDMNELFEQMGQIQEQMQKAREELANETVDDGRRRKLLILGSEL